MFLFFFFFFLALGPADGKIVISTHTIDANALDKHNMHNVVVCLFMLISKLRLV